MNWKFSEKFRSQWIKVKFYKQKPAFLQGVDSSLTGRRPERLKDVRFCEATKEAIIRPVIIDKESISCPGARYCFGWEPNYRKALLDNCQEKRATKNGIVESLILKAPYFKEPFDYIGLNTDDEPDLVMSYMPPEEIMRVIKIYNNHKGLNLNIKLFSMVSICGGIAVRTYLENEISFSFGCDDSRKYADIRRENLAVGIPNRLFKIFVD